MVDRLTMDFLIDDQERIVTREVFLFPRRHLLHVTIS